MKSICLPIIIMVGFLQSITAYAFDPFTAAAVVTTVAQTVSSISDSAGEVAGLSGAFSELYSEVDTDAQVDESARRLMNQVNEIKRYADELGYTEQELSKLTSDQYSSANLQKLTQSLRNLTHAIRSGKRAIRLFSSMKRKVEAAQVESARTQAESLAALYLILEQEQKRNLDAVKKELKDRVERIGLYLSLERDMANGGAKYFKGTRILAAIPQAEIVQKGLEFSRRYLAPLSIIMLVIFCLRIVTSAVSLDGADSFVNAKKDLILCGIVLVSYTLLIHMIFDASAALSQSTQFGEFQSLKEGLPHGPGSIWEALRTDTKVLIAIGFQGVKWLCFTLIEFIVNWVLSFMIGILPLVAVLAIMTGHRGVVTAYLVGIFALSLWVMFWNLGGYIASGIWATTVNPGAVTHTLKATVYSAVATLAQLVSPITAVAALKMGGASPAATIGGLAIKGGAAKVTAGTSLGVHHGKGMVDGFMRNDEPRGSMLGRAVGFAASQTLGRLGNGVASGVKGAKGQQGIKAKTSGVASGFVRGAAYHDGSGKRSTQAGKSRSSRALQSFNPVVKNPRNTMTRSKFGYVRPPRLPVPLIHPIDPERRDS